jgi:hypothetical protein
VETKANVRWRWDLPSFSKADHKVYGAADSQDVGVGPVVVGVTLLLQKWRAKLAATKAKSRGASFEESFGGTGKTD